MGVVLTPIISKQVLSLADLARRTIGVDAHNELYQFLALIRLRDGTPLRDAEGRITSHLAGLFFRTMRLVTDYRIRPVFVFDGPPPPLKQATLAERRTQRGAAARASEAARQRGDYATAWSKAVVSSRLTSSMIEEAKTLLDLLGLPVIQAPSEGEAEAAYLAAEGRVWAVGSRDYDSLLFGAPRLVRYITIAGTEYLPSKGVSRPLHPELIELATLLRSLRLTRVQLVDLALLVGTDFNRGVRGIGPKKALQLLQRYARLEDLPGSLRDQLPPHYAEVRQFFLDPPVSAPGELRFARPDAEGVLQFLCDERSFQPARVRRVLDRLAAVPPETVGLDRWVGS